MERRRFLEGALLLGVNLSSSQVLAMRRTPYGGQLHLSLPLGLSRLDPHDPEHLASALFGTSIFDSLYALDGSGRPYPTLVEALPSLKNGCVEVHLREELEFSNSSPLSARAVASSLLRSAKMSTVLLPLANALILPTNERTVRFRGENLEEVARLLASPRAAIVPVDFSPNRPVGSGALKAKRSGSLLKLERNYLCPRGGAFIDAAELATSTPTESLRAFEARRSQLGFLGRGLHQERKDAADFQLDSVAQVVLEPGRSLKSFARPGVLQSALESLPQAPLEALGLSGPRQKSRPWAGPTLELLVDHDEPWLRAIAEELAQSWSRTTVGVRVTPLSRTALQEKRMSADFDAIVSWRSTVGLPPKLSTDELFLIDGRAPPRGGRTMSPQEAARQLNLGIVGELRPYGAVDRGLTGLMRPTHFDLGGTYFSSTRAAKIAR